MITSMNLTDDVATLILHARDGSHEAFGELVRTYQGAVRSYLCRFLRGTEAVDDLAQEVFLVAFRRLNEYRGEAPFQHWLLGIARNQALVYMRGEVRRRQRERRAFEAAITQWQTEQLDALADAEEHENTVNALRDCIDQLPTASRGVLDRFYFQNQSSESIARELDKKNGAIRMMLLRIRQALGKCVGAKRTGRGAK